MLVIPTHTEKSLFPDLLPGLSENFTWRRKLAQVGDSPLWQSAPKSDPNIPHHVYDAIRYRLSHAGLRCETRYFSFEFYFRSRREAVVVRVE